MDSSSWFDTKKNLGWSCLYLGVAGYTIPIKSVFLSLKFVFVLANSVDLVKCRIMRLLLESSLFAKVHVRM